jgi:hypothetical protein
LEVARESVCPWEGFDFGYHRGCREGEWQRQRPRQRQRQRQRQELWRLWM